MGQYQEWLQYQALDRKLRAQLQALETIQSQVQEQLQELRKQLPQANNPILLALAHYLVQQSQGAELAAGQDANPTLESLTSQNQQLPASPPTIPGNRTMLVSGNSSAASPESFSNALSSWGGLPDFDPQNVPTTPRHHNTTSETARQGQQASQPFIPPLFSLPTGKSPFPPRSSRNPTRELSETSANSGSSPEHEYISGLEIPAWLQHITVSTEQGYMPIDPESIRTNRLVQRWLTRWGKQAPPPLKPSEDPTHE